MAITPKENVAEHIKRFIDLHYSPYMLRTRGSGRSGISPATAYQVKICIVLLSFMNENEIAELRSITIKDRNNRDVSFAPFIDHLMTLVSESKKKAEKKVIAGNIDYSDVILKIKAFIEDFLVEQEERLKNHVQESWKRIHNEYKNLSREDFQIKYSEKKTWNHAGIQKDYYYNMNKFKNGFIGKLLMTNEIKLPEIILKLQKEYRNGEYLKVESLIYRLKNRYPNLRNIQANNFNKGSNGLEFNLTATDGNEPVSIHTNTIFAGGYNIQRFHLRWLMLITDSSGKRVKIEI